MWSPFGPFWSAKYLNFGQKLPIRTTHQTFLESRHPEVTKNPYHVLSPEWSQRGVSVHGLYVKYTSEFCLIQGYTHLKEKKQTWFQWKKNRCVSYYETIFSFIFYKRAREIKAFPLAYLELLVGCGMEGLLGVRA